MVQYLHGLRPYCHVAARRKERPGCGHRAACRFAAARGSQARAKTPGGPRSAAGDVRILSFSMIRLICPVTAVCMVCAVSERARHVSRRGRLELGPVRDAVGTFPGRF